MTELENWLTQATRRLSRDSAARVRTEIQQHYDSAREAALARGATSEEASRAALAALGDATAANCQYCKVLLTSAEARVLREGNWEARAICSRPLLKQVVMALPVAALAGAAAAFFNGPDWLARPLLALAMVIGVQLAAPFLPVYTPARGRIFRVVKWAALLGAFGLALGSDTLRLSWLLAASLWPLFWIERTRHAIRRKLPVAQWPKQLYL